MFEIWFSPHLTFAVLFLACYVFAVSSGKLGARNKRKLSSICRNCNVDGNYCILRMLCGPFCPNMLKVGVCYRSFFFKLFWNLNYMIVTICMAFSCFVEEIGPLNLKKRSVKFGCFICQISVCYLLFAWLWMGFLCKHCSFMFILKGAPTHKHRMSRHH